MFTKVTHVPSKMGVVGFAWVPGSRKCTEAAVGSLFTCPVWASKVDRSPDILMSVWGQRTSCQSGVLFMGVVDLETGS